MTATLGSGTRYPSVGQQEEKDDGRADAALVEPVYIGGRPEPHYALRPWVQPRARENDELIDTREMYGNSEPVLVAVPKGSTAEDTPQGVVVRRPDGGCSYADAWGPPRDGRITPDQWFPA